MCSCSLTSLDAGCAKANGIAQIISGCPSMIFSFISVNIYAIPTIFFLLGGIFTLLAGIRRSLGWIVTALIFAAINTFSSLVLSFIYPIIVINRHYSTSTDQLLVFVATAVNIVQFSFVLWAVFLISCPGCCHCRSNGNVEQQQQQPHVVRMLVPTGADGGAATFILMPANAEQIPIQSGQMPINAGQIPLNAGQAPIYAGQMPMNAGQISVQTGQLQTSVHHVRTNSPPPSYDDHSFSYRP